MNPVPAVHILAILGAAVVALLLGPCVVDLARRFGLGLVTNLTFMPMTWLRMIGVGRQVAVTMWAWRRPTFLLRQIPILVQFRVQAVVIGGVGFVENLYRFPMGADSLSACRECLVYRRSGLGALVTAFESGWCNNNIGLLGARRLTYRYDH